MKNTKCIIGATLLAPVFLSAIGAVAFGIIWLTNTYKLAGIMLGIFFCLMILGFLAAIWVFIYKYCVEHSSQEPKPTDI